MYRTTIMLPFDLKNKALQKAKNQGISLGQLIREGLKLLINDRSIKKDPFFTDKAVFSGQCPDDLSKNHDKYIYGE